MSTIINDLFTGSAGNLSAHTGTNGETWSGVNGTGISLSGSGTIYNSSGSTSIYAVTNKFGTSTNQTLTATINLKSAPGVTTYVGLVGWGNNTLTNGYVILYEAVAHTLLLYKNINGAGYVQIGTGSATYADGDTFGFHLSAGSQVVLKNGSSVLSTSDSSVTAPAVGSLYNGIWFDGAAEGTTTGIHFTDLTVTDAVSALLNAAPTITSQSTTSVTLQANPSAGVAPYTYQWYASTTANFTAGAGNILAGQTSSTLTTAVTGTPLYVRCTVTDSAAQSVTSYQRMVVSARDNAISIMRISDSTSTTPSGTDNCTTTILAELQGRLGVQTVTMSNQAVAGTATADWAAGGTNMNTADAAIAAFTTRFVISIELGINDLQGGVSSGTFNTNMSAILTHLLAQTNASSQTCLFIVLDYCGWREPGFYNASAGTFSESYSSALVTYNTVIDGLVNGTTIIAGDTTTQRVFAQYPSTFMGLDGDAGQIGYIHPNTGGARILGMNITEKIWNKLYPSTSAVQNANVF